MHHSKFSFTCLRRASLCYIQAVGYPFDIIKTRIQATNGVSVHGVLETARQLVTEANGSIIRGLYRGFGMKLARSIPASMIGFLTYEVVSKGLIRRDV